MLQNLPASSDVTVMMLMLRKNYRLFQLGFLVSTSGQSGAVLDVYLCHLTLYCDQQSKSYRLKWLQHGSGCQKLVRNASWYMWALLVHLHGNSAFLVNKTCTEEFIASVDQPTRTGHPHEKCRIFL